MPDPYAGVRVAHEKRARLIRSVFEPSPLEEVALAMSEATEQEPKLYVERLGDLWRWSLVHSGGPYPLLRVTARFLKMDYTAIFIGHRQIKGGLSVLTRDPGEATQPDGWAVLRFKEPASVVTVIERIRRALPVPDLRNGEPTGISDSLDDPVELLDIDGGPHDDAGEWIPTPDMEDQARFFNDRKDPCDEIE
jgi:hypothetical protein